MIKDIPIKAIKFDPDQPRKFIDQDSIKELAENIKTHGLINAIEVDQDCMIVTGERRLRACKLLGWSHIQAKVIQKDENTFLRQISENIHQGQMSVFDEGNAYKKLLIGYDNHGNKRDIGVLWVANKVNKSNNYVAPRLYLVDADQEEQQAFLAGKINLKTIGLLKSLEGKPYKQNLFKRVLSGEIRSGVVLREIMVSIKSNPSIAKEILQKDFTDKSEVTVAAEIKEMRDKTADELINEENNYFENVDRLAQKLKDLLLENPFGNKKIAKSYQRSQISAQVELGKLPGIINQWLSTSQKHGAVEISLNNDYNALKGP